MLNIIDNSGNPIGIHWSSTCKGKVYKTTDNSLYLALSMQQFVNLRTYEILDKDVQRTANKFKGMVEVDCNLIITNLKETT